MKPSLTSRTTWPKLVENFFIRHRWVKFEEDVEEGGSRWSKPHVATLSLHSLFELRSLILNGAVLLDAEASTLCQIADLAIDSMVNTGHLPSSTKDKVSFHFRLHTNIQIINYRPILTLTNPC